MAKITNSYNTRRDPKYPIMEWSEKIKESTKKWEEGKQKGQQPALSLRKGRDFDCEVDSLCQKIWEYNKEFNLQLSTRKSGTITVLLFWKAKQ